VSTVDPVDFLFLTDGSAAKTAGNAASGLATPTEMKDRLVAALATAH
jgi:hypothetical protein